MDKQLIHMLKVVVIFCAATIIFQFLFTLITTAPPLSDSSSTVRAATRSTKQSHKVQTYPNLTQHSRVWIHVSLNRQRVFIMDGNKKLYTMLASTGVNNSTPTGTFYIEAERGTYFYAPQFKEGAYDWVSWKDHGVYLFHSTPTDEQKHVLPGPQKDLGKRPSSHGCVHLSLKDAHWFYSSVPTGTKVVISKR